MLCLPQVHGVPTTTPFFNKIDIFNPLRNTYRFPERGTFADLKWLYQQIFTRQNIVDFPCLVGGKVLNTEHYNPESYRSYWTTYHKLVPLIPDDKLWLLGFAMLSEKYSGDMTVYFFQLATTELAGSERSGYRPNGSYGNMCISYDNPGRALEIFLQCLAKLGEVIDANLDKKIDPIRFKFPINDFFSPLQLMFFGQRYVFRPEQPYDYRFTADEIAQLMRANPNTVLRFRSEGFDLELYTTVTDDNRSPLYDLLNYSANPMRFLTSPRVDKRDHKPVLYGVELEVATNYSVRDMIDAQKNLFFIAKSDGSITGTGRTKAELVTVPMSLRMHKKDWAHWFKKLDYTQFDCTTQTNNGQHVHVDKESFLNDRHRDNFIWFFVNPCNKSFITAMSERTAMSMQQFAPLPSFSLSSSLLRIYRDVYRLSAGIRGTINLNSRKPTIEVRLFRGIVSYASILKNLEFVDAVFHFTQDIGYKQNTLRGFFSWLESLPRNRYKVLRKYFAIFPKLEQEIAAATLGQMTWGVTDPERVVAIINKSKLPLSAAIATILNKGQRRTYVFNKKTGQLEVCVSNRSRIHHLDRTFEALYTRNTSAA